MKNIIKELLNLADMLRTIDLEKNSTKDIKALLNGQKLYATINDEYAFTIGLEKEVE